MVKNVPLLVHLLDKNILIKNFPTGFNILNFPTDYFKAGQSIGNTVFGATKSGTWNIDNLLNPHPVSLSTLLNPHPVSLASIPNPSNLDVALSARTLTKHDNKTYVSKVGRINATALLSIAVAGKLIKAHSYSLQSESDSQTAYFYEETSATQLSQKWVLNAREGVAKPFVPAPAQLFKTITTGKDLGLNLANATYVNYEIQYSVDDAS